jgi:hypothetical protein
MLGRRTSVSGSGATEPASARAARPAGRAPRDCFRCCSAVSAPRDCAPPLDWPDLPGRSWRLTDILGPSVFKRDGGELASPGLFVDLAPWQFHLLALQ